MAGTDHDPDNPPWHWRLIELVGISWPGRRKARAVAEVGPRCAACHNRTRKNAVTGEWKCPHHPTAALLPD